jgi:membrane protein involved in colicin uptake
MERKYSGLRGGNDLAKPALPANYDRNRAQYAVGKKEEVTPKITERKPEDKRDISPTPQERLKEMKEKMLEDAKKKREEESNKLKE